MGRAATQLTAVALGAVLLLGLSRFAGAGVQATRARTTLYISPAGSDGGRCGRVTPCLSFDRAYRVARPGDLVEIAGGTYAGQVVRVDKAKLAAKEDVVFQPRRGATVTIAGNLVVYGSRITFRRGEAPAAFRLRQLESESAAGTNASHHVTYENLDGEAFEIGPSSDITIKGGDWGPSVACHARGSSSPAQTWCPQGSPYAATGNEDSYENKIGPSGLILGQRPRRITLDGVFIHDQNSLDLVDLHQGGLFVVSGSELTIRNARFERNVVYNIQIQDFTTRECCGMTFGAARNVLIERNRFSHPVEALPNDTADDGQADVQLNPRNGEPWANWTIRRNSFENGIDLGAGQSPRFERVLLAANLGGGADCFPAAPGLSFSSNVWEHGGCRASDTRPPFGYALREARLVPSSGAVAVRRAFELAAEKATTSRIALALRQARLPSPRGQGWSSATVSSLLADRVYLGNRYGAPGAQVALVTPGRFRAAQRALD